MGVMLLLVEAFSRTVGGFCKNALEIEKVATGNLDLVGTMVEMMGLNVALIMI